MASHIRNSYSDDYSPPLPKNSNPSSLNSSRRSTINTNLATKNSTFTSPLSLPKEVNSSRTVTPRSSIRGGIESTESSIRSLRSSEKYNNGRPPIGNKTGKLEASTRKKLLAEHSDDCDDDDCNLVDCDCFASPGKWITDFAKDYSGSGVAVSNNVPPKKWRQAAAQSVLSELSDDDDDHDEEQGGDDNSDYGLHNKKSKAVPYHPETTPKKIDKGKNPPFLSKERTLEEPFSNHSALTSGSKSVASTLMSDHLLESSEPRIVAPNVDRLSPSSVVEIRLQSINECVAVLCSVDVLKMRSGFFHQVLVDQERINVGAKNDTGTSLTTHSTTGIWRDPITVPENSPFEAAAFLESIHEGRSAFKGDWNFTWTRLSVTWKVDLIDEYANLIEMHVNRLLTTIHDNHWRSNPDTLVGYRIAVFRKTSGHTPSVTSGTVVESASSTGYSKLRVMFDVDKNNLNSNYGTMGLISPAPQVYGNSTPLQRRAEEQLIGDVCEPFWVQHKSEGSLWMEPDDVFTNESKRHISILDKRIFWEMSRAVMDHPELSAKCKSGIRNSRDLAAILKRPENRVLFIPEAPDLLPKEAASEIITFCFLKNFEAQEK